MKIKRTHLILVSGLIWLGAGVSLMKLGIKLLALIPSESVTLLIAVSLLLGILKGKFVLKKSAIRVIERILALPNPAPLAQAFSKKYLLLIFFMMGLGMFIKYSGMPSDIRGFIDLAVGAALVQGSTHYFRALFS